MFTKILLWFVGSGGLVNNGPSFLTWPFRAHLVVDGGSKVVLQSRFRDLYLPSFGNLCIPSANLFLSKMSLNNLDFFRGGGLPPTGAVGQCRTVPLACQVSGLFRHSEVAILWES